MIRTAAIQTRFKTTLHSARHRRCSILESSTMQVAPAEAQRSRRRLSEMPKSTNGKICYIEMPATDIARSSDFYSAVFGWNVRKRGDGATAFDDTTGEVSGAWVPGRPPAKQPG